MKVWIFSQKTDLLLFVFPVVFFMMSFSPIFGRLFDLVTPSVLIFVNYIVEAGHIWLTVLPVYFVPNVREKLERKIFLIPIFVFFVTLMVSLYSVSVLLVILWGYLVLFHFMMQFYGLIKVTQCRSSDAYLFKKLEVLSFFAVTIAALLYWHATYSAPAIFNYIPRWFPRPLLPSYLAPIFLGFLILGVIVSLGLIILKIIGKSDNNGSGVIIIFSTIVYGLGLTVSQNPLIFLILLKFTHGLPYFFHVHRYVNRSQYAINFSHLKSMFIFFAIASLLFGIIFLSGIEAAFRIQHGFVQSFLLATLMTPFFTHILYDGLIWRNRSSEIL